MTTVYIIVAIVLALTAVGVLLPHREGLRKRDVVFIISLAVLVAIAAAFMFEGFE